MNGIRKDKYIKSNQKKRKENSAYTLLSSMKIKLFINNVYSIKFKNPGNLDRLIKINYFINHYIIYFFTLICK